MKRGSRGVCFAGAILMGAAGCPHDQLQTARVFSESQGQIVVAMPENTPGYRKLADRLAIFDQVQRTAAAVGKGDVLAVDPQVMINGRRHVLGRERPLGNVSAFNIRCADDESTR